MWMVVLGRAPGSRLALAALAIASVVAGCETDDGKYVYGPDLDSALPDAGEHAGGADSGGTSASAAGGSSNTGGRAAAISAGGTSPGTGGSGTGGSALPVSTGGSSEAGAEGGAPPGGEGSTPVAGSSAGGEGGVAEGGAPAAGAGGAAESGGAGGEPSDAEGGTAGDPGVPDPADVTPPTVVRTSPVDGADGVPGDVSIEVELSEPLADFSVTDEGFSVESGGSLVAGTLSQSGNTVTFTPSAPLSLLAEYTVTLTPDLTDVAGNPLAAAPYTFSFRMADGEWKASAALGAGSNPRAALDDAGNGAVAWTQFSPARLWGAITNTSDGFASAVSLELAQNASTMKLAQLGPGTTVAVWIEGTRVRSSSLTSSGWSTPAFIDGGATSSVSDLVVAGSANGVVVAAWSAYVESSGTRAIWGNRLSGAAWGTAQAIQSSTTLSFHRPQVAIGRNGTATVVCTRYDSATEWVFASTHSGSGWATAQTLETITRQDPPNPSRNVGQVAVAADATGRALAIWSVNVASSPATTALRFARSNSSGTWPAAASFGTRRAGIWLAGSDNGDALGGLSLGVPDGVYPIRYSPSSGWAELDGFAGSTTARGGIYLDVGLDALGNGFLTWDLYDYPRASRFLASEPESSQPPEQLANTGTTPALAVSRRGSALVAWVATENVSARRFDFAD